MRGVECEYAFIMGRTLEYHGADFSQADVLAAVDSVRDDDTCVAVLPKHAAVAVRVTQHPTLHHT